MDPSSVDPGDVRAAADRHGAQRRGVDALRRHVQDAGRERALEVVATHRVYKLRRYFADDVPTGLPPMVLAPPLMFMADVRDVTARTSAVRVRHDAGIDAWVVDFGRPEKEPGGLRRALTDHVLPLSDVVDEVRAITGVDVRLGGYSQGRMFAYQTAAHRRGEAIDSLVTYGAPVGARAAPIPIPISPENFARVGPAGTSASLPGQAPSARRGRTSSAGSAGGPARASSPTRSCRPMTSGRRPFPRRGRWRGGCRASSTRASACRPSRSARHRAPRAACR